MKLVKGRGSPEEGGCWMVAASMYSGEGWHDHPSCVPATIRVICIAANDLLPDGEREKVIGPILFEPLGRDPSIEAEIERANICADWAVERYALSHPKTREWAKKWLSGEDRSYASANTASYAASNAASYAANAASYAANAASHAANAASRAASYAAHDAASAYKACAEGRALVALALRLCKVGKQVNGPLDAGKKKEVLRAVCREGALQ